MEHKNILAERIRQRRVQKGYSQEFLAESANVSVRTLQRIEGGQTEPRGHTLLALAMALDMAIEDLMDFVKKENNSVLHAINLSALSFWMFPVGNMVVPMIIWIINKDKVQGANRFGKRQLLIQTGWTMLIFLSFILFFLGPFLHQELNIRLNLLPLPFIMIALVYGLNTLYIGIVSILISKNKRVPFLGLYP
jgi:transcriptional regulator with XRE-family HTH domain